MDSNSFVALIKVTAHKYLNFAEIIARIIGKLSEEDVSFSIYEKVFSKSTQS